MKNEQCATIVWVTMSQHTTSQECETNITILKLILVLIRGQIRDYIFTLLIFLMISRIAFSWKFPMGPISAQDRESCNYFFAQQWQSLAPTLPTKWYILVCFGQQLPTIYDIVLSLSVPLMLGVKLMWYETEAVLPKEMRPTVLSWGNVQETMWYIGNKIIASFRTLP